MRGAALLFVLVVVCMMMQALDARWFYTRRPPRPRRPFPRPFPRPHPRPFPRRRRDSRRMFGRESPEDEDQLVLAESALKPLAERALDNNNMNTRESNKVERETEDVEDYYNTRP